MENIATVEELLNSLPEEEKTEEVLRELPKWYESLVPVLRTYGKDAKEPKIVLYPFNKCGTQYIADFSVSDKSKPEKNKYNWHLQNTSQWLFAGCIMVQHGKISVHT